MLRKLVFTLLLVFLFASVVYAAPILSVGDYEVMPGDFEVSVMLSNTSDQTVGEEFDFFGFRLDISPTDGGLTFPDPIVYVAGDAINPANKMWFEVSRGSDVQLTAAHGVFSGDVYPFTDGAIFTVGFSANSVGLYDLLLTDVEFGHGFTPGEIAIENGSVNVVPIPGSVLLFGSGLFGLMGIGRRRMRKS